jgi:hypothetical protein
MARPPCAPTMGCGASRRAPRREPHEAPTGSSCRRASPCGGISRRRAAGQSSHVGERRRRRRPRRPPLDRRPATSRCGGEPPGRAPWIQASSPLLIFFQYLYLNLAPVFF